MKFNIAKQSLIEIWALGWEQRKQIKSMGKQKSKRFYLILLYEENWLSTFFTEKMYKIILQVEMKQPSSPNPKMETGIWVNGVRDSAS